MLGWQTSSRSYAANCAELLATTWTPDFWGASPSRGGGPGRRLFTRRGTEYATYVCSHQWTADGSLTVRRTLQRNLGQGLVFAAPKTAQSRRSVPMPSFVIVALRTQERADSNSLVFSNRRGQALDPGSVNAAFTRALQRASLPHVRVHDLRHTTASILLASSTHPKVVQELLGHRTVALTLDIYSHLRLPMVRTAATVMESALGLDLNSASG